MNRGLAPRQSGHAQGAGLSALRRAAGLAREGDAPLSVYETLRRTGTPLDTRLRGDFEARTGHDFSGVRVHTDDAAAASARDIGALAYTAGRHVVFNRGRYAPHTSEGRSLLAHELTHVNQQRGAPVPGAGLRVEAAGEHEARQAEAQGVPHCSARAGAPVAGIQRAPDAETLKKFDQEIAGIRKLETFKKKLDADQKKEFEEIVVITRQRDNALYYSGKLKLLFTTPESDPGDQSARFSADIKQAADDEKVRVAKPNAPSTGREENVSTLRTSQGKFRKQVGLDKKTTFEIDDSDLTDIAVRVKVHLHPTGRGKQADVDNVESLEDAIEKRATTGGYSFDVVFVKSMVGAKNDVFDIPVDTAEWTTAGNFAGDSIDIVHELHHVLGLEQDRYDYIEAHAGNADMKIPDRVHWFREEFKKKIDNDSDSIMDTGKHVPLDDDVCRVTGRSSDAAVKACVALRAGAREKQLKPAVDLARTWLKQAAAKPAAANGAVAKRVFAQPPSDARLAEIINYIPNYIIVSNLLPHSEIDPDCQAGRMAFAQGGIGRQIRYCPLFLSVAPGFAAQALIVEALHLAGIGAFTEPACPKDSGCDKPCGDAKNANAWARFIDCAVSP